MNKREMCVEFFREHGTELGFVDAKRLFRQKFGQDIDDSTFYTTRKSFRQQTVSAEVKTELNLPQNVLPQEVTLEELKKLRNFVDECGGWERFELIVSELGSLLD